MLTKRAQILFEKELWKRLVELAKAQKTSAGQIVRESVEEKLDEQEKLAKRKTAIETTLRIRPKPFKGKIDYKELINYGRKY